jgi:hypothetical protein
VSHYDLPYLKYMSHLGCYVLDVRMVPPRILTYLRLHQQVRGDVFETSRQESAGLDYCVPVVVMQHRNMSYNKHVHNEHGIKHISQYPHDA